MKKAKILYISYDGLTDPLGQSQIIPYLIGLAKHYEISVISCEKPDNLDERNEQIKSMLDHAFIQWFPLSYTKKPPIFSTIYDIYKIKNTAIKLTKKNNFKIVHCRSYISALVGLGMKRKFDTKFIFDMRGFWADERVDGGLWPLSNPIYNVIYKFFKRKEKEFLENADFVISLTVNAKSEIENWNLTSYRQISIQVIPCCVDTELFAKEHIDPDKVKELRNNLSIKEDDIVLLYLGAIGTWYMLDEMLDFFKRLKIVYPEAKFVFITAEDSQIVKNAARRKNIDASDIIVRKSERKDVPLHVSIADLSIFFIKPTYSKRASSPTKQGELMSMGIPVVCNKGVGDTNYVLNKYNSGILVNDFNEYEYDLAIKNLNDLMRRDKTDLRKGAVEFFSLETGIELYRGVYEKLLN